MSLRRVSWVRSGRAGVLCLAVVGCGGSGGPDSGDTTAPGPGLRVLTANVGHLGELTGVDCPSDPYDGALCSVEVEGAIASALSRLAPDVAFLQEVLDADLCSQDTGADPDLPCTGAAGRDPYHQVQRLLGTGYAIACDGIAHYDCVAVRTGVLETSHCAPGEVCMGGAETPPHPPACDGLGGITSVSAIDATWAGGDLRLVSVHPLNSSQTSTDPCRLAQYEQAFEDLADSGPTLLAGDFNYDPIHGSGFPSGDYWLTQVGEGLRYTAHNAQDPDPLPTWLGLGLLDFVISDVFEGGCQVLGESEGTERLDAPHTPMDHRAVVCDLAL